jgi:hypothetical protein
MAQRRTNNIDAVAVRLGLNFAASERLIRNRTGPDKKVSKQVQVIEIRQSTELRRERPHEVVVFHAEVIEIRQRA